MNLYVDPPVAEFRTCDEFRSWLEANHTSANGIWVRIYCWNADVESIAFDQLLDGALCFGWSDSARRGYDRKSYPQQLIPCESIERLADGNLARIERLKEQGRQSA